MSSFTSPLVVEVLSRESQGRLQARLLEPFEYYTEDRNHTVKVPAGFITDFASVPRFFWRIAPPFGRYAKAAVVHDYLCELAPEDRPGHMTRRRVDEVFWEGMRVLDVRPRLAFFMWLAVRAYAVVRGVR